jgi:hypothetical protein
VPHDGEGKIGSCPGPGCDCDEKNYGHVGNSHRQNLITTKIQVDVVCGLPL